jgi:hypothetical protein
MLRVRIWEDTRQGVTKTGQPKPTKIQPRQVKAKQRQGQYQGEGTSKAKDEQSKGEAQIGEEKVPHLPK